MSDQDSNPKQTGSTPHACKHPFVWPNGDCVRCGVFVTTLPAHTEPTHTMLPRKLTPLIATLAAENAQLQEAWKADLKQWGEESAEYKRENAQLRKALGEIIGKSAVLDADNCQFPDAHHSCLANFQEEVCELAKAALEQK